MHIDIVAAYELLKRGEIIGVPTDTVYGVAADWKNSSAIEKIYQIKKRPPEKALIVLFSKLSQIEYLLKGTPKNFEILKTDFWPGALTLVMPIKEEFVLPQVRSENFMTGFRIPQHPLLLQLLDLFGPIVAPSANLSGGNPAISSSQVEEIFGADFPVLDGGVCKEGKPSTILSYESEEWKVLREGALASSLIFKQLI